MAAPSTLQIANGRCLKRSFTAVTISIPPSPDRHKGSNVAEVQARKTKQQATAPSVQKTRLEGRDQREEDMPSAAPPRMYENQIPSFMSVYDMDSSAIESPGVDPPSKLSATAYLSQQLQHRPLQDHSRRDQEGEVLNSQLHSHQHQHRESTSTQASDSTESSPTTTISTVDSSSLSDPSPSSSPESPITLVPLSSFSNSNFGLDSFQSLHMADNTPLRLPLADDRPMTSPSPRKPKNPKSLALNLNSSVEALQTCTPPSPSFIKPPPLKGRRKPSLLSLNTGAANKGTLAVESVASPGIPTMLQRRGLKHSISSPQILATPGFAPVGGMTLGERTLPRLVGISSLKDSNLGNTFTINEDADHESSGIQMATRLPGVTVGGDSFDRPHSGEDAKSPSYPEGPILMHEPSVHLYLEPKLEEAMKFDVIINVAKEVKNPFKESEGTKEPPTAASDSKTIAPEPQHTTPDTAASLSSFQTAFEVQPSSSTESSPTTPKPATGNKVPEYIHVPWDHNTDVKDELWDLCQTIEARTKEGKRVLVHCQQGASRSATLIIAYGMYINQDLGPNEAYTIAQAKSRWVNPNMSLLFSLNDFKKVIEQKKSEKNASLWKPAPKHRQTLSADTLDQPPTPTRARGNSTPSSCTREEALTLTKEKEAKDNASISDSTIRRFADFDFGFGNASASSNKPLPLPPAPAPEVRREIEYEPPKKSFEWEDLLSPRIASMTENPLATAFGRVTHAPAVSFPAPHPQPTTTTTQNLDLDASTALFSPLALSHPRTSFFDALDPSSQPPLPAAADPRSPATQGEVPISRSIDDFL
jgi:tyrosine-protein phosphatase